MQPKAPHAAASGTAGVQQKIVATVVAACAATAALMYIASISPIFATQTRRMPFTLSCLGGGGIRGGKQNSSTAGVEAAAPSDTPPAVGTGRDPWLTAQACTLLADESELCDYKGPVCVALGGGGEATVYVSHSRREMEFDPRDWCYDARGVRERCWGHGEGWRDPTRPLFAGLETSWPCGYGADVTRPNLDVAGAAAGGGDNGVASLVQSRKAVQVGQRRCCWGRGAR